MRYRVGGGWLPEKCTYCSCCRHFANSLPATESLSQVYKLKNHTFIEQCRRQIRVLQLYYGNQLDLPLTDVSQFCSGELSTALL